MTNTSPQATHFAGPPDCAVDNANGDPVDLRSESFASIVEDRSSFDLCHIVSDHPDASVRARAGEVCGGNSKADVRGLQRWPAHCSALTDAAFSMCIMDQTPRGHWIRPQ